MLEQKSVEELVEEAATLVRKSDYMGLHAMILKLLLSPPVRVGGNCDESSYQTGR